MSSAVKIQQKIKFFEKFPVTTTTRFDLTKNFIRWLYKILDKIIYFKYFKTYLYLDCCFYIAVGLSLRENDRRR